MALDRERRGRRKTSGGNPFSRDSSDDFCHPKMRSYKMSPRKGKTLKLNEENRWVMIINKIAYLYISFKNP